MTDWNTELPDFTVYGFHIKPQPILEYRLKSGVVKRGVYQGYGIFGAGSGDWDVEAWRLVENTHE